MNHTDVAALARETDEIIRRSMHRSEIVETVMAILFAALVVFAMALMASEWNDRRKARRAQREWEDLQIARNNGEMGPDGRIYYRR